MTIRTSAISADVEASARTLHKYVSSWSESHIARFHGMWDIDHRQLCQLLQLMGVDTHENDTPGTD